MPLTVLRGRGNIRRVFGSDQARRSDGIVLHWAANGLPYSRYAVAAKTQVGNAVERNRVRRWARELMRSLAAQVAPGHDLVIIAREREAADSFAMFGYHLRRVLRRAELLVAPAVPAEPVNTDSQSTDPQPPKGAIASWLPWLNPLRWPALPFIALIQLHRYVISPLTPPSCRFTPSCSRYGLDAVTRYGAIRGGWLAFWRVLRCNPFHRGGYDPLT